MVTIKSKSYHRKDRQYEKPITSLFVMRQREIICVSVWENGNLSDEEQNWNVIDEL